MMSPRPLAQPPGPSPGRAPAAPPPPAAAPPPAGRERPPPLPRTQPRDVAEALRHPCKQFLLWDVRREVLAPGRLARTPAPERARPAFRPAARTPAAFVPAASRALRDFAPAGRLAARAHTGLRAALRVLLRRPPQR
ncbi:MAG: hypothetical protein KatS3mg102_2085 [Planctomycetota bacterium]|nr:MAG: hypothetical protein KatS3mg102_2085 [Planctomycetota bacterium]